MHKSQSFFYANILIAGFATVGLFSALAVELWVAAIAWAMLLAMTLNGLRLSNRHSPSSGPSNQVRPGVVTWFYYLYLSGCVFVGASAMAMIQGSYGLSGALLIGAVLSVAIIQDLKVRFPAAGPNADQAPR